MKLRLAKESEMQWVNQRYDEVGFVHSHFNNELIAIAECEGQRAGLGRLVTIDQDHLELGGMYVLDSFRGKGLARAIVQFLLKQAKPTQTVYCIPFEHLIPFYQQCGFRICSDLESVPQAILEKRRWCTQTYANPTSLLVKP